MKNLFHLLLGYLFFCLVGFNTGLAQNHQIITGTITDAKPYIEASIGVLNIFKIGRIDLVKRLTYLDAPNVPSFLGSKGLGIRFMLRFEF